MGRPCIAIAGFQHETNSFANGQAGLEEFEIADSWPALLRGSAVIDDTRGMNLPIAGFAQAAQEAGANLRPILWCAAEPSGPVTDEAFETISGRILDGLRAADPLHAIYLDLHGAMITDSHQDGEGALLERIRALVGPDIAIAISLDLHANVSARLVELTDDICIYRTYPHLDMAQTGVRAWHRLERLLTGQRAFRAFRQAPFAVPLHAQHTGVDPARTLYAALPEGETHHVEMALGFTAGDTPDRVPSVIAHAPSQPEADMLADAALDRLCDAQADFPFALVDAVDAVQAAVTYTARRPVILADVQDNPGAGASSDTTGLLRALIAGQAQNVLMGLFHDPNLAGHAMALGTGDEFEAALGGRSGLSEDRPYEGRFRVEATSTGQIRYTGEMYGGGTGTLGPSCALRVLDTKADIVLVVSSIRNQCLDQAQFTHFGLDPTTAQIIVVKSTAHFRADFEPIASAVIPVTSPGLFRCDV